MIKSDLLKKYTTSMNNMKITVFYRHQSVGYSIQRVIKTIMHAISNKATINEVFLPHANSDIFSIVRNGFHIISKKNTLNYISGDVHYLLYFFLNFQLIAKFVYQNP